MGRTYQVHFGARIDQLRRTKSVLLVSVWFPDGYAALHHVLRLSTTLGWEGADARASGVLNVCM